MNIEIDISDQIKKAELFVTRKETLSYVQFKDINQNDYKMKGIVYFIFVIDKGDKLKKLKYIGKSDGKLFSKRMSDHFKKEHNGTHSKRSRIVEEENNGNELELSYITISPKSFRNAIEEELISIFKGQLWNGIGKVKIK